MVKHVKILGILVFLFSCKQATNKPQQLPLSPVREVFKIDTVLYKKENGKFYTNSTGDIFELKTYLEEDSAGFYQTSFLDSVIFVDGFQHKEQLKDVIDLSSFKEDSTSLFSADKNHVYYMMARADGSKRYLVEHANSATFKTLFDRWGKDDKNVFYENKVVINADVNTFKISLNSTDSAKDKNHIFYRGALIK